MTPREEIREVMKLVPVAWLHQPKCATTIPIPLASAKDGAKVWPVVAYAAVGAAAGGALQLASQYINTKSTPTDVGDYTCDLTTQEIEDRAVKMYEDSLHNRDGGALKCIAEPPESNAKIIPVVLAAVAAQAETVAFIGGVAAGAWAAGR